MDIIHSAQDLMQRIEKLSGDNSVCQIFISGKSQFTIVLQANEQVTIADEVQGDSELCLMIEGSRKAHKQGEVMTTAELLTSVTKNDFQ